MASGDRGGRAHLAHQAERGDKPRDGERAKRRPVGDLRKRLCRQQTAGKTLQGKELAPQVGLEPTTLRLTATQASLFSVAYTAAKGPDRLPYVAQRQ